VISVGTKATSVFDREHTRAWRERGAWRERVCGRCEDSARLVRRAAGSEAERRCEAGRAAIAIMRCRS